VRYNEDMQERLQTKKEELAYLANIYQQSPELFLQRTFVEDAATLSEFGISIPGKEQFVPGFLKYWPEDFIVEEIGFDGTQESVFEGELSPNTEGNTVYATLVKCGVSTIEAVEDLSRMLGISKEQISYAGMKDKAALTAQKISVRGSNAQAVSSAHSPFFYCKDVHTGKGVAEKGRLTGNRFTILVRTPGSLREDTRAASVVAHALERVHEEGFYNFFYLQRFGTPRLRNYQWAYDIMRGNYEAAVFDMLTFGAPRELEYFRMVRRNIEAAFGRWDEVEALLAPFPVIFSHERKVVAHLRSHPGDYVGALQTISEQVTLWLYALSSLLFNKKISSYLSQGKRMPQELPLLLSPDRHDHELYRSELEAQRLYPLPLKNLRPFPSIQLKKRMVPTYDRVRITGAEVLDEGLLLQFALGKGQYATTFLSHVFDLASGKPMEGLKTDKVDTTKLLGGLSLSPLLERFSDVLHDRPDNMFDELLQKGE